RWEAAPVRVDVEARVHADARARRIVVHARDRRAAREGAGGGIPQTLAREHAVDVAVEHVRADVGAAGPRALHVGAVGYPEHALAGATTHAGGRDRLRLADVAGVVAGVLAGREVAVPVVVEVRVRERPALHDARVDRHASAGVAHRQEVLGRDAAALG